MSKTKAYFGYDLDVTDDNEPGYYSQAEQDHEERAEALAEYEAAKLPTHILRAELQKRDALTDVPF